MTQQQQATFNAIRESMREADPQAKLSYTEERSGGRWVTSFEASLFGQTITASSIDVLHRRVAQAKKQAAPEPTRDEIRADMLDERETARSAAVRGLGYTQALR